MLVLHTMMSRLKHTKCLRNLVTVTGILLQIQAFCYRYRHPATDPGILLQIRVCCYRFRHSATDSGILIQVQASCYRYRHSATDSGFLLHMQASCYRFRHSATDSSNLLQGHAIWYRVIQSDTGLYNLQQEHYLCYAFFSPVNVKKGIFVKELFPKGWKLKGEVDLCSWGFDSGIQWMQSDGNLGRNIKEGNCWRNYFLRDGN